MCDPKRPNGDGIGKSTEAGSPVENCPGTLWVELDHRTEYIDDYGQNEPAARTPYRLTFGDGSQVEGELDENGFARYDGIPDGEVEVEYEPDIDQRVAELKQQLQEGLDELVAAEREEYEKIEKELENARLFGADFPGSNAIAKGLKYTGAALSGLWNGVVGIFEFAWDVVRGAGKLVYELGLRTNPITAPEKFKEDLQTLKNTYEELKRFADEDLEAYIILMGETDIYAMFGRAAVDLAKYQHALEITEAGGEVTLDVALAILTAGAGAAASVRHAGKLKKLKAIVDKLVDALKRKHRRQRRDRDTPNRRIVTRVAPRKVPCFCPFKGKRFQKLSPDERRRYLEEYARQLRRQEQAINDMTVDDYLAARELYDANKRNALAADAQRDAADKLRQQITTSIEESLSGKYGDPEAAKREAAARADEIMKSLNALHEPDMNVGGYNNHEPGGMGDASVNKSIGGSWEGARRDTIDSQAVQAREAGHGKAKMNVKLEVCRGRSYCK